MFLVYNLPIKISNVFEKEVPYIAHKWYISHMVIRNYVRDVSICEQRIVLLC